LKENLDIEDQEQTNNKSLEEIKEEGEPKAEGKKESNSNDSDEDGSGDDDDSDEDGQEGKR
jgi:hypothetical protein